MRWTVKTDHDRRTRKVLVREPNSKRHLRLDVSVADLLKMLTYAHVCCAFSSACALTSNLI
ncbi:MAG: hypothetical protein MUE70_16405 [Desulfobacterales bacterium]|nr:hypothetical protein [Desulfobacterales bacterium]